MIIDFLFPVSCICCGQHGQYICSNCRKKLQPHPEICPLTHKASPWYAVRQDLLVQKSPLDGAIVLFRFEPLIRKLIINLKYSHRAHISTFLGERLALALQSHDTLSSLIIDNSKLLISYVPSHRIRHHITKWYNQSQLLATALTEHLWRNKPIKVCKKRKNTHSQVGMTREQRKQNLSDAFHIITPIPTDSTILIVDDVLTSGATMIEVAKTIKTIQPKCKVWWICVARNG